MTASLIFPAMPLLSIVSASPPGPVGSLAAEEAQAAGEVAALGVAAAGMPMPAPSLRWRRVFWLHPWPRLPILYVALI